MATITQRGLEILQQKLADLTKERVVLRSRRAHAFENSGDGWHDNPEFEAIEADEKRLSTEIDRLTYELTNAIVIAKTISNIVGLNSTVELEFENKEKKRFTIGDTYTADPSKNIISLESPLGKSIVDGTAGDERTYIAGNKKIAVRIISVE